MPSILRFNRLCVCATLLTGLLLLASLARGGFATGSPFSLYCNADGYFLLLAIAGPIAAIAQACRSCSAERVRSKLRRCQPWQLAAWALACGACMWFLRGSGLQHSLRLRQRCRWRPGAQAVDWGSDVAVAYVCIGKGCRLELLQAAVTSLRRCGEWDGAVYVATDRPADVVRAGGRWGGGDAVKALAVDSAKFSTMEIKHMKQRLFSLAPVKHQALIYLDVDVLTLSPVSAFMGSVVRDNGGRVPPLAMFRDNVCLECNRFNCGVVVMRDEPETRECMAAWSAEMARDGYRRYHKEQNALDAVLARGGCAVIECLSTRRIVYTTGTVRNWLKLAASPVAFAHLTHGWRQTASGKSIMAALERELRSIAAADVGSVT